jgi:hypothetical protein
MCGTGWSITLSIIEIEHDAVYSVTAEVKSVSSASLTMPVFQIKSIASRVSQAHPVCDARKHA